MFLKFRYRLGYESLCREVSDSISWRRFCRIPFGTRVPHPTTLMKITTRCGEGGRRVERGPAGQGGRSQADAHRQGPRGHHGGRGRMSYPTDSGLLAKAMVRWPAAWRGSRPPAVRPAPRRGIGGARRGAAPLDRREAEVARRAATRCPAQAAVRRITGELADIAGQVMSEATVVIRNGRRALRTATGQRKGRLHRAINRLDTLVGCAERVVAQTRPPGRGDARVGEPGGQPARCRCPPDPQRTFWASPWSSVTKPRS